MGRLANQKLERTFSGFEIIAFVFHSLNPLKEFPTSIFRQVLL